MKYFVIELMFLNLEFLNLEFLTIVPFPPGPDE